MDADLSDRIEPRIFDLLDKALAEEGGGMVEGFVLAATYIDAAGDSRWVVAVAPGQRTVTTVGHIETLDFWGGTQLHAMMRDD